MSSPADITFYNFTKDSIKTRVTRESWMKDGGKSVDGVTIPAYSPGTGGSTYRVEAKTAHHGELDIELSRVSDKGIVGTVELKSIKDPQEGEKSFNITVGEQLYFITAMGFRHSPGNDDLRRIWITINRL